MHDSLDAKLPYALCRQSNDEVRWTGFKGYHLLQHTCDSRGIDDLWTKTPDFQVLSSVIVSRGTWCLDAHA